MLGESGRTAWELFSDWQLGTFGHMGAGTLLRPSQRNCWSPKSWSWLYRCPKYFKWVIWLQLPCNSHFLGPPPRKVEDKIFLPLGAASITFGRDGLVVVGRVSFGRFGGQEGLVGQAVASSVDLWELDLCVRWFWGCRFLWLGECLGYCRKGYGLRSRSRSIGSLLLG